MAWVKGREGMDEWWKYDGNIYVFSLEMLIHRRKGITSKE
jgi:hypothetical protein